MTKFICPKCNKEMTIARIYGNNYDTPPADYQCLDCDLYYLTPYNRNIKGSLSSINGLKPIAVGDFIYCCRIYKLKAFT